MTQHSTSDDGLSSADFMAAEEQFAEGHAEQSAHLANSQQPAIVHPNFDPFLSAQDGQLIEMGASGFRSIGRAFITAQCGKAD